MHNNTRIRTPGSESPHSPRKHSTTTFVFFLCVVSVWIYGTEIRAADNPSDSPRRNDLVGPIDQSANPNEVEIGIGVENVCPQLVAKDNSPDPLVGLERDLRERCTDLLNEAGGVINLSDELRQLTSEEIFAIRTGTVELGALQLARIGARLSTLRTATGGDPVFALGGPDASSPGTPLSLVYHSGGAAGDGFSRLGVFVNGTVANGDKDQTTNEAGFDFDGYDLTVGLDYRIRDSAFLGIAVGFSAADADMKVNGTNSVGGNVDTDGFTVTGYGTAYRSNGVYVSGSIGYGDFDYESERDIAYAASGTSVIQRAVSDTDGDQGFAHLEIGKDTYRQGWTINVSGRLDYLDGTVDAYTERMLRPDQSGGGMALEIGDQNIKSFTSTLGVQFSKAISTARGVAQPFGRFGWIHQFEDDRTIVQARFVFDPFSENFVQGGAQAAPTIFAIESDKPDTDYFRAGGGLSFQFAGGKAGFVSLDTVLGLDDITHWALTAGFRWEIGQGTQ